MDFPVKATSKIIWSSFHNYFFPLKTIVENPMDPKGKEK